MVILSQNDIYSVELSSLIADYDRRTLIDLYMPIVGYQAICIYFCLWSEAENQKVSGVNNHEYLLVKMHISTGAFIDERKKLEAIGLLKTYLKKENDCNFYTYRLLAPKTPHKFFDDTLLYGLLIKYLGEKASLKLKLSYQLNLKEINGDEISASFGEVFKPNYDDDVFKKAMVVKENLIDRIQSKVDFEFNFERFINMIKTSSQISETVFTKKVLKEIERLVALYGIDEESAALAFIESYDFKREKGDRIDFKRLTTIFQEDMKYPFLHRKKEYKDNTVSSNTPIAKKINLMETMSCKDFLRILQNNTMPVASDLKIIDDLSSNLQLKPAVINAILDYTLQKNHNVLSRPYIEKIAASISREKIDTAYDTMNFLNSKSKKKAKKVDVKLDENTTSSNHNIEDDRLSDEERSQLLKELLEDEDDGKN